MEKEITVGGLTRQKYISSKRDGKAIKEDYILTIFFKLIYFIITLKT